MSEHEPSDWHMPEGMPTKRTMLRPRRGVRAQVWTLDDKGTLWYFMLTRVGYSTQGRTRQDPAEFLNSADIRGGRFPSAEDAMRAAERAIDAGEPSA